jgi:hypothetical protein
VCWFLGPVATWAWPTWVVSRRRVLEAVFILLEFSSPSRRICIGSHSLPLSGSPYRSFKYITFGDNGKGRVLSVGTMKVSESVTLRRVSLVKSLGYNLLSVSQVLDEGFEVRFKTGCSRVWMLEAILCVRSSPRVKFSEPIFLSVLALLVVWLLVFRWSFGNGIGDEVT